MEAAYLRWLRIEVRQYYKRVFPILCDLGYLFEEGMVYSIFMVLGKNKYWANINPFNLDTCAEGMA